MSKVIVRTSVNEVDYAAVCDRTLTLAHSHQSVYIVAANVHVVMTACWHAAYRKILDAAAIVTPDGMPLVWGMRLLGAKGQSRVYGPDLMLALCDRASKQNLSIYLYGSTSTTLSKLSKKLQTTYPNLVIAGTHSPPFRALTPTEEATDIEHIRQSGAAIVFVGLGCPKQEEWMYRQLGKLNAVMVGVGAAFQFHSGDVAQAPRWMMRIGMEWLFRLSREPQRLWSRYLLTNTAFVTLFTGQLIHHAILSLIRKFSPAPSQIDTQIE